MDWKTKLSSRKFWITLIPAIGGIFIAVFDIDPSIVDEIAGYTISLISSVIYVITEGKIDAAAVSQAAVDIESIVDAVKNDLKAGGTDE